MKIPEYLINEHYNDRFFDVVDAIAEAQYIHIQACGILKTKSSQFVIGETGFGAGRVLLALLDALNGMAASNLEISYYSVELHPLSLERMASILKNFRGQTGDQTVDSLLEAYSKVDITKKGWQEFQLKGVFGVITIYLWIGEALDMLNSLNEPCDAWFLEGHGPKKNPSLWRYELLKAIGNKTRMGGVCSSFTVSGPVRRALESSGFMVERPPGYGGKKMILKAIKTSRSEKACNHGWEDDRVGFKRYEK